MPDVIAAARIFVRSSNPEDEMFVVNFNENVTLGLQGLYSSHLVTWRRERDAGILPPVSPAPSGPCCGAIQENDSITLTTLGGEYRYRVVSTRVVAPTEGSVLDPSVKQNIQPGQLTVHADRGSAMTSKPVAFLMADLGVTKTHSRPYVSDDNPYSESQFRTLKYRPDFPDRFGSIQDARAFCLRFFPWYNDEHRHSALGLMTPAMVHYDQAPLIRQQRQLVLDAAYQAHPERFVRRPPRAPELQQEVWINKPPDSEEKSH